MPFVGGTGSASNTVNFGASAFTYTPPTGYTGWAVPATNNMTLVTTTQTADATVSNARALLEIDPIDSITFGTDLTIELTCDGGTTWTAAGTYTNCGKGQAGRTVVETDDAECTSGTSFAARIKNPTSKLFNVYKTTIKVH